MVDFFKGDDYPNLCPACQHIIDQLASMFKDDLLPDTDDEEAPCDYMYDHKMFCSKDGTTCVGEKKAK